MQATRPLFAPQEKHLLLCLDAFGTLFTPRVPIAVAYAKAAAQHGIDCGDTETGSEVGQRFKDAFKQESKRNPNYGKAAGLGAEQWWGNVIRSTFTPFLKSDQKVPPALVADLLRRYSTNEGYRLYPDVPALFRMLQGRKGPTASRQVIVGIITNSDDRVPGILQSFGLKINSRRFVPSPQQSQDASKPLHADPDTQKRQENGMPSSPESCRGKSQEEAPSQDDVDFVILSYDVGHEKPDHRIFDAAQSTMKKILAEHEPVLQQQDFKMVYVGDDVEKDYDGARAAGCEAALVDRANLLGYLHDYSIRNKWIEYADGGGIKLASEPVPAENSTASNMEQETMDADQRENSDIARHGKGVQKVQMMKSLLGVRKWLTPPLKKPLRQDETPSEIRHLDDENTV